MQELGDNVHNYEVLSLVKNYVVNGWPKKRYIEERVKLVYLVRGELPVYRLGCLVLGCRAFIPLSLRARVMCSVYEGHLGIEQMKLL